MAEYLIQDTTLINLADLARSSQNAWEVNGPESFLDDTKYALHWLNTEEMYVIYREFIDYQGEYTPDELLEEDGGRTIVAYSYGNHPISGAFVPILYWTKNVTMGPDIAEPLYYTDNYEENGVQMNIWQKFDWDTFEPVQSAPQMYVYTPQLITGETEQYGTLTPQQSIDAIRSRLQEYIQM